ncbi:pyridoxal phosphate-dependent transferase [Astrocystis sublimbata]|nr:pyridoxal phosphate-dependent transferase [Astrocystis sublimbata]
MDFSNVSGHMSRKLQHILPTVAGAHQTPPEGILVTDLSTAENALIAEDILPLQRCAIAESLSLKDLSYPPGFGGDPELLKALADFFNTYFNPSSSVEPGQIITTAGAGNALSALISAICDPGDEVLVLGPCWEGFDAYFTMGADVKTTFVTPTCLETATQMDIVEALQAAYEASDAKERIKAVALTNPLNPLGQCYSVEILRKILEFCEARGMHLVSDEVYAISSHRPRGDEYSRPFVSVLALEEGDSTAATWPSPKVHVIWSMSKDFGSSGTRMGCIVSQANQALRFGAGLASYWQTSSLTSVVAASLLRSPQLPSLIQKNSERLGAAYRQMTDGLSKLGIKFISADYGLFVFAKIGAHCQSAADEVEMIAQLVERGLIVAPGRKFSCGESEHGWARITFAVSGDKIENALGALGAYLGGK